MVWNAPSWPLKGDNWKIQDEATVKVETLWDTELAVAKMMKTEQHSCVIFALDICFNILKS